MERRGSIRGKGHGSSDNTKSSKRRWDDADTRSREEDSGYEKNDGRGNKHGIIRERSSSSRNEFCESKNSGTDPTTDKGVRSSCKDERRIDGERTKIRGISEAVVEDGKASPSTLEEKLGGERQVLGGMIMIVGIGHTMET